MFVVLLCCGAVVVLCYICVGVLMVCYAFFVVWWMM